MLPAMQAIHSSATRTAAGLAALLYGLALGGEASALSARETDFQDWRVRCETPDNGSEECMMAQAVRTEDGQANIMHITVRYPPKENAAVTYITVPLSVYLPNGLTMSIDQGKTLTLPFELCNGQGCHTRILLEDQLLQSFKNGGTVRFEFLQFVNAKKFVATVSLKGFTAAFDALK